MPWTGADPPRGGGRHRFPRAQTTRAGLGCRQPHHPAGRNAPRRGDQPRLLPRRFLGRGRSRRSAWAPRRAPSSASRSSASTTRSCWSSRPATGSSTAPAPPPAEGRDPSAGPAWPGALAHGADARGLPATCADPLRLAAGRKPERLAGTFPQPRRTTAAAVPRRRPARQPDAGRRRAGGARCSRRWARGHHAADWKRPPWRWDR